MYPLNYLIQFDDAAESDTSHDGYSTNSLGLLPLNDILSDLDEIASENHHGHDSIRDDVDMFGNFQHHDEDAATSQERELSDSDISGNSPRTKVTAKFLIFHI